MTETETAPVTTALPPRARLLHIGLPKSGTTFLQRAAAANREHLLAHGVRYPGTAINHRLPVLALMGEHGDWGSSERVPKIDKWNRLLKEVEAETERRVYLSNESLTLCSDTQAARFVDALGVERTHVLVTIRGYAALLASNWQQHVKTGARISFARWLNAVLSDPPSAGVGVAYHQRLDAAGAVTRWARLLGPERVTVVIADKTRPTLLTDALADLLGLPRAVLAADPTQGFSTNRSMSLPEVEMVRALNEIIRVRGRTDWAQYALLVRNGATARMLQMRRPGPNEPAVQLPEHAAEVAQARAQAQAEALAASGARLIGDLASLTAPVPTVPKVPRVRSVPVQAAAEALAGAVSAATGRRAFFGADPDNPDPPQGRVQGGKAHGITGKVWVGPAASPKARKRGAQRPGAGAAEPPVKLSAVLGPGRVRAVQEAYRATENLSAGTLLSVTALRLWRRVRNTDRARRTRRPARGRGAGR